MNTTKHMLKTIHDLQLMTRQSTNLPNEAIISTLRGIDEILSNVNFTHKQLTNLNLQYIITNPHKSNKTNAINKTSNNIEDKGYKQRLEFKFNDNDMLLYKIFNKQTANNIINILNSKITKSVLVMIVFASIVLFLIFDRNIVLIFWSFVHLMFSVYAFGWILYCNTHAMNMLLKEFEFWFKIVYLGLYSITRTAIQYVSDNSLLWICTSFIFDATILFLVMIFDAINIKQSNKIMISSFTLGIFSFVTLVWSQNSFYRNEHHMYDQLTVTIPDVFGVGLMTFNIMDIAINSAQTLAIFLFKQMITSIVKPKQALVIKNKPFIIYENSKENVPTIKTVKNWKLITVLYSVILFLAFLAPVFLTSENLSKLSIISTILCIIFVLSESIVICLFITGKVNLLWTGNIMIIVLLLIYAIAIFLQKWPAIGIMMIFIQFGFASTYIRTVSKFKELKLNPSVNASSNEKSEQRDNSQIINYKQIKVICNDDIIEPQLNEIEIPTVNNSNKWKMTDQAESIDLSSDTVF